MTEVLTLHTSDLDAATRTAVLALLADVFDDLTDADREHALGGVHALVREGADVVAHAAVVQRRILHGGRTLRAGYVEAVAVRADRRGRGLGAAVMAPVERVVRRAYDLGALGATDLATTFYAARGWQRWAGPTSGLTPDGVVRTPDEDDAVFVLPVSGPLDLTGEITCDWREGDLW